MRGTRTQEGMAKELGITKSSLAIYERNKRVPSDEVKIRIANYFGKTVQEIFLILLSTYSALRTARTYKEGGLTMKQLIPMDTYGVFTDTHDTARVNSLFVAKFFEKEHKNVLRDISQITDPKSGLSEEFSRLNFEPSKYTDERGKKQPCFEMTRDGFTLLAMGYTGAKAMKFKELYIRRFNEMENFINTLVTARREFPLLTENIKLLHENAKPL